MHMVVNLFERTHIIKMPTLEYKIVLHFKKTRRTWSKPPCLASVMCILPINMCSNKIKSCTQQSTFTLEVQHLTLLIHAILLTLKSSPSATQLANSPGPRNPPQCTNIECSSFKPHMDSKHVPRTYRTWKVLYAKQPTPNPNSS